MGNVPSLDTGKSCNLAYCNAYQDLKNAFCDGGICTTDSQSGSCSKHWNEFGKREGRMQCGQKNNQSLEEKRNIANTNYLNARNKLWNAEINLYSNQSGKSKVNWKSEWSTEKINLLTDQWMKIIEGWELYSVLISENISNLVTCVLFVLYNSDPKDFIGISSILGFAADVYSYIRHESEKFIILTCFFFKLFCSFDFLFIIIYKLYLSLNIYYYIQFLIILQQQILTLLHLQTYYVYFYKTHKTF